VPDNKKYKTVTATKSSVKKFNALHKKIGKHMNTIGFFDYILEVFEKAHCPECNSLVEMRCHCKDSETL